MCCRRQPGAGWHANGVAAMLAIRCSSGSTMPCAVAARHPACPACHARPSCVRRAQGPGHQAAHQEREEGQGSSSGGRRGRRGRHPRRQEGQGGGAHAAGGGQELGGGCWADACGGEGKQGCGSCRAAGNAWAGVRCWRRRCGVAARAKAAAHCTSAWWACSLQQGERHASMPGAETQAPCPFRLLPRRRWRSSTRRGQ